MDRGEHWDRIYTSRSPHEVSWYEPAPVISPMLIAEAFKEGAESIIDVGGGASSLVDHVLDLGIERVAVLDISEAGLAVSKRRLGDRARLVQWIVGDVTTLEDLGRFDVWHDRAVFHFLTDDEDRRRYVRLAERTVEPDGTAIMATFAADGPERCSGLDVRRYESAQLTAQCGPGFELTQARYHLHTTPGHVQQNFLYATFRRATVASGP
jgi:SAM-dependent methyltransferase